MNLKEFIEVTSIYDGRKAAIRAACIDAVVDNAPEHEQYADGLHVSNLLAGLSAMVERPLTASRVTMRFVTGFGKQNYKKERYV